MRVLGLDPGYNRLGVAVVEEVSSGIPRVHFSVCLETSPTKNFSQRLHELYQKIESIIDQHQPTMVAMEKVFLSQNKKTAMAVAETRGMLKLVIEIKQLPLVEYAPQQIKLTVAGSGRADKTQVKHLVSRLTGLSVAQKLDDEVDAVAIALTTLAHRPVVINNPT